MLTTNSSASFARASRRTVVSTLWTSRTIPASAFSTSPQYAAPPSWRNHVRTGHKRQVPKNKRIAPTTRPPAIGERKAFRKRILLSNNNALPVRGLGELTTHNIIDPNSTGQMIRIPDDMADKLRAVEAFKPHQSWGLFRAPSMLIRRETVDLAKQMVDAVGKKQTKRVVLTGIRGCGKSMLGLQAVATGFLNDWVVINIPEGT